MASYSTIRIFAVLLLTFWGGDAYAMTFSLVSFNEPYDAILWVNSHGDKKGIYAEGEITDTTAQEFKDFIVSSDVQNAMILFNSPGGSLIGGMRLGEVIRTLGFDTGIATFYEGKVLEKGVCASACAYAFAGGAGRYFYENATRLGVHQFYSNEAAVTSKITQEVSGSIVAYLQKMGVNALAFSVSTLAGSDDMLWLTPANAIELKLANNGTRPTDAELKQAEGYTYLRIEQEYTNYSARFLIICHDGSLALQGGLVTDPDSAKDIYDWATHSLLTFDTTKIQPERKSENRQSLGVRDSVVWVNRQLVAGNIEKLLSSNSITLWIGADGAIAHTATADISAVGGKIRDYIKNCHLQAEN